MAESLATRLGSRLRQQILTGVLAPGTVVVEPRLAADFAVSKTPVREALQQLASEGLLTVLPKKGYLVRTMGLNDVQETLDLRMLLEPHAARSAAGFLTDALVADLRQDLDAQREAAESAPLAAMSAARSFHRRLASGSRNGRLAAALDKCLDETARAHHVLPGLQDYMGAPEEQAEHELIYAAVAAGDPVAAESAMRAHLRSIHAAMASQFNAPGNLWG
ncbi:GntR family transcriptional regulator [Paeniglutamicibacter cryotolerans]|uniref:DNA-binding GntR family transcriptional regulator n=1 Tax=Paeniglutamicibacter cryotolerans TaxID=670079 RepID=A0A839QS29_9MICC|nr:GntR family transcriptional regulator [Paeniglutamicibacter cryotolerans]MBB2994851.1 DNA-binding GntR family transcriptional regulator [Paeniglutamicibacter cryotolerans]